MPWPAQTKAEVRPGAEVRTPARQTVGATAQPPHASPAASENLTPVSGEMSAMLSCLGLASAGTDRVRR